MAPAIVNSPPQSVFSSKNDQALADKPISFTKSIDTSIFPDGIKTTGQHPPIPSQIYPYSQFPKAITGPTVWSASEYTSHPERWVHPFSPSEIAELSEAADAFLASGTPLTGITKTNFPLPNLAPHLESMRNEILNGKGFILYKNVPVHDWGNHKSAVAYLGLGIYIGYPVSQNSRGHILGHVKDLREDSTQTDKVRIYRTNARQFFHADDSDVVGLLCVAKAEEGGESDLASVHSVWNILQEEFPDVAELFTQQVWYFDRKGEQSQDEEGWIKSAVFYLEPPTTKGGEGSTTGRVYCKFDPYYVTSLKRFSDAGLIPALSAEQQRAVQVLEDTCNRIKLHMILDVGDIQFLSNSHILHARTAYRDFPSDSGNPKRHLMRLWLSTPVSEGGWSLPFWDNNEKKRGGIQVDNTRPVARLDAD